VKQRKALQRRTPLKAKTQLSQRSIPRSSGPVKPRKHPAVTKAEKDTRNIVRTRSGGLCELHGGHRGDSMHHRKNRSQGGQWTPGNILHLCGDGTTGAHGWITEHPLAAEINGWAVKSTENPSAVPVLYRGRWVLLDDEGGITPSLNLGAA
jgi:hypothetical protein